MLIDYIYLLRKYKVSGRRKVKFKIWCDQHQFIKRDLSTADINTRTDIQHQRQTSVHRHFLYLASAFDVSPLLFCFFLWSGPPVEYLYFISSVVPFHFPVLSFLPSFLHSVFLVVCHTHLFFIPPHCFFCYPSTPPLLPPFILLFFFPSISCLLSLMVCHLLLQVGNEGLASEDDADTEEALKEFDFLVTAEDGEGAGEARSSGDGTEWGELLSSVENNSLRNGKNKSVSLRFIYLSQCLLTEELKIFHLLSN